MPATTTMDELINIAAHVGVYLSVSPVPSHLYAIVSQPGEHVLYIGKGEDAGLRRARNEASWRAMDPQQEAVSGLVCLMRRNNAHHVHLRLEGFDAAKAIATGDQYWERPLPEIEDPDFEMSVRFVEEFLIRVAVRLGVPIANSQFAGQFVPKGDLRPADRLAMWAVNVEPLPEWPAA